MRTEKGALPYRHTPCTGPAPLVAAIHPGDDALLSLAGQLPNKTTTPPSPSFPLCSGCNDNARATRLPPPAAAHDRETWSRPSSASFGRTRAPFDQTRGRRAHETKLALAVAHGTGWTGFRQRMQHHPPLFFLHSREGGREPVRSPGQCELERRAKRPQPLLVTARLDSGHRSKPTSPVVLRVGARDALPLPVIAAAEQGDDGSKGCAPAQTEEGTANPIGRHAKHAALFCVLHPHLLPWGPAWPPENREYGLIFCAPSWN
jgi:hypothetical protein